MDWLFEFLSDEASWHETIFWVLAILAVDIIWSILIGFIFYRAGIKTPDSVTYHNSFCPINNWHCFVMLLLGACWEEYIYRFFPIYFSVEFLLPLYSFSAVIAVVIIASAIFGWAHGSFWCVFIQGFAGFLYSLLFLKCGGLTDNFSKAFIAAITAHFTHNYLLFMAAYVIYKKKYVQLP